MLPYLPIMVMVMAMIYGGEKGNGDDNGIKVTVMMDNDDKGPLSISY